MSTEQKAKSAANVPVGAAWNDVTRAGVMATLVAHRFTLHGCSCGWRPAIDAPALPAHEIHVAEVLIPRTSPGVSS